MCFLLRNFPLCVTLLIVKNCTKNKETDILFSIEFKPASLSPRAASALNMDSLLQEIEKKPVQVFDFANFSSFI
jgi:hypothetical protein